MTRPVRQLPEPRAMIVAPQPEAVEAGTAVLAQGGSAVDAGCGQSGNPGMRHRRVGVDAGI